MSVREMPAGAMAPPADFAFIVGSGRCGSSLLQELVSRHPGVGFLSNIDDLVGPQRTSRLNNAAYRFVPQALTKKGRVRFAPSEGYRVLERQVSPIVCAPGRPLVAADATPWLAGRFARFFGAQAAGQGKPAFVHKFTGWSRVGFIEAAMPQSRYVHVVRDGRAVANSLVQMPWWTDYRDPRLADVLPAADLQFWRESGMSYPLLAGLVWKAVIASHEAVRPATDGRWLEVRYEDLLADPVGTLRAVTEHFELDGDRRFERSVARCVVDSKRSAAYTRQLTPRDIDLLEQGLGPVLDRYGYPTRSRAHAA